MVITQTTKSADCRPPKAMVDEEDDKKDDETSDKSPKAFIQHNSSKILGSLKLL